MDPERALEFYEMYHNEPTEQVGFYGISFFSTTSGGREGEVGNLVFPLLPLAPRPPTLPSSPPQVVILHFVEGSGFMVFRCVRFLPQLRRLLGLGQGLWWFGFCGSTCAFCEGYVRLQKHPDFFNENFGQSILLSKTQQDGIRASSYAFSSFLHKFSSPFITN